MDTLNNVADGLDIFMRTLGIDAMTGIGFGAGLAIAFQSVFMMFFIVAPIMGLMLFQNVEKRSDAVIAWGIGMIVMLIGAFGLAYILRLIIPDTLIPDGIFALLMSIGSISAGILIARYIRWWLAPPGETGWIREFRQQAQADMSALERRHRHNIKANAPEQRAEQRAERVEKSIYNRKRR